MQENSDWHALKENLHGLQRATLEDKVFHSITVLERFCEKIGTGNVYVSFSGGADSLVCLHLARTFIDKNIKAVFCNTGQEWPQVVKYVKQFDNVDIIRPRYNIKQVFEKTGFPLVSKEVSSYIRKAQTLNHDTATYKKVMGTGKFSLPRRWRFLADKDYRTSEKCCYFLKKAPFHRYEKETGKKGILGIMASESRLRELTYFRRGGCNSFSERRTACWPIATWTTKDVWDYIRHNKLPYCDIYDELDDKRTGCVCCGYGVTLCPSKLNTLYRLYPHLYLQILKLKNNNIEYRTALKDSGMILPDEC